MNCTSARFALALIPPSSPDSDVPEFAAELAHVRECPECQAFRSLIQESDRELAAAIQTVPIPAGLNERLLKHLRSAVAEFPVETNVERLETVERNISPAGVPLPESAVDCVASSTSSPVAGQSVGPISASSPAVVMRPDSTGAPGQRIERRRLFQVAGVAAAVVMGLGLWFLLGRNERTRVPLDEILAMGQQFSPTDAMPFRNTFELQSPHSTFDFSRRLRVSDALSFGQDGGGHDRREIGAVWAFAIPVSHPQPLEVPGCLIVIDLSQVEVTGLDPVAGNFASASVEYPAPNKYATRVWRDADRLYICFFSTQDPAVLDKLLPRFSQT